MWTDAMIEKVEALEAEEARLKAALEGVAQERDVALAEVERLRAVLEKIANGVPGCDAEYLARQALGIESEP